MPHFTFSSLRMQRNPVLGGALADLYAAVAKKLGSAPEWTHLRFARRCLV